MVKIYNFEQNRTTYEVEIMGWELTEDILQYLKESEKETIELIEKLCGIPAPSHHEERRAEFIRNWLTEQSATDVTIDEALNVVYPVNCEGKDDIVVFMAHTDTVFPDMEPMPFINDGEYLRSPGVGDDTTHVAILLMIAKYVAQNHLQAPCGILFVANSCEEGLGNLKGVKQIMTDYEGRIREVYSLDSNYTEIYRKCVGSHRYEILFETEGGHSYSDFGNCNAIHAMADLVCRLYEHEVPVCGDSHTTYNVGIVEGGTSVNTIAQNCKLLYEYRSDSAECLASMKAFFEETIQKAKQDRKVGIVVNLLGVRPCGENVDEMHLQDMFEKTAKICEKHSGETCVGIAGSTDCNIPMSLGVPSIAFGCCLESGAHTREEKVLISSISVGMKIAAEVVLRYFMC